MESGWMQGEKVSGGVGVNQSELCVREVFFRELVVNEYICNIAIML